MSAILVRHVLLRERADQIMKLQAGDRQHGSAVHLRVIEAVQQMNAARSGRGQTDTKFAGVFGIAARHEGRGLLVPDVDEADLVLMSSQ